MKPKYVRKEFMGQIDKFECPKCELEVFQEREYDRCPRCNTRLDWEEEKPMKVIWQKDIQYDHVHDRAVEGVIPECPRCHSAPTYNLERCPYCGLPLEYDYSEVDGNVD